MKAPDIRKSYVDTTQLVIVGLDVEVDDANRDYYDEEVESRVLLLPSTYNAASEEEKREWDDFCKSISDNGLLQPPIVDAKEVDGAFVFYVVDGRRRAAAMKQLLKNATESGDEAAVKKFSRTPVTPVAAGLSRADVAVIANQFRKEMSVEQQIRICGALRDSGMEKADIAKRLNCSENHTDKLYRRYKSIPGLRLAIISGDLNIREGDELTWCCDDHELQTKAFNIYMQWRENNFCSKRKPAPYVMAQRFHKFVMELGIDVTVSQLQSDISMWKYGATDKATVPTIDGTLADGSGGDSKPTTQPASTGGGSGGGVESLKLEESDESTSTEANTEATPAEPAAEPAVTTRPSVGFKLTTADLKLLLTGNYRGIPYADGLNVQARALLELILLGKPPEKVNAQTKPLLYFLAWEDKFDDEFKRVYGDELWMKITDEMESEDVPQRK